MRFLHRFSSLAFHGTGFFFFFRTNRNDDDLIKSFTKTTTSPSPARFPLARSHALLRSSQRCCIHTNTVREAIYWRTSLFHSPRRVRTDTHTHTEFFCRAPVPLCARNMPSNERSEDGSFIHGERAWLIDDADVGCVVCVCVCVCVCVLSSLSFSRCICAATNLAHRRCGETSDRASQVFCVCLCNVARERVKRKQAVSAAVSLQQQRVVVVVVLRNVCRGSSVNASMRRS